MKIAFVFAVIFGGLVMPHSSHAQVTLSGTLYSDAGTTPQAVSKFIAVAVGTSTPSVFASTTLTTTGAWTVTIPAGHGIGTSTPILVWVNDDATIRASVLTKASSSASVQTITGLDLYQSRVIARHEGSGTSTTFADFSFYTSAQDSDLQHSTSSGLLTITPGNELYIWGGDTFAPGSDVRVLGNASASSTDGSLYLAGNAVYTAGGTLTLGGSLTAVSTATFTGGAFKTIFNATTTGKTINAPIASLGNITFNGAGGAWSVTANATTTNLTILLGTVSTPGVTVSVTGTYQNDATFNAGSGTLNIVGATTPTLADFVSLTTARDASGMIASTSPTSTTAFAVAGNILYIAKAGGSQSCGSAASTTAGNCELMVYNIASTTNPVFVTARDSGGSSASTSNVGINQLVVAGNMLYVAKAGSAIACTQVAGTADGCELMVFDISSTTDPIFRAGRDADGNAAGTTAIAATSLAVSSSSLYMAKGAAGTTNCSTTQSNCELMVFNISSTTNPLYITGRDTSGSNNGTQTLTINGLAVVGNALYTVKAGSATLCNPTAGNAVGCELMVFDISSTSNPSFTTARDAGGSNASTSAIAMNFVVGTTSALYVGKAASAVQCSEVAGLADGCGVMVFDISSTTNPVYRRGVDASGAYDGIQAINVNGLSLHKNYLFVAKAGSAIVCDQVVGLAVGCELTVFDVSSSSALRMIAARDAGGDAIGIQNLAINTVIGVGDSLYVGKAGNGTSCAATAGNAVGCELMVFDMSRPASGLLLGTMVATSTLGDVTTRGVVEFRANASTSDFAILSGTTTAPSALTVAGDYNNSAIFTANEGTIYFASSTAQTISGTMVGTSSLYKAVFVGAGTKTIGNNASTSFFEVQSGATVVAPTYLSVGDTFTNNGTFDADGNTLYADGYFNEFTAGISAGGGLLDNQGLAFNNFINAGNTLYAAKAGNGTACSQVAGLAVGCELMVFDISDPNNIIYRAGRDAAGSHASTSATSTTAMAIAGNTLYVAKAGGSQSCGSAASTTSGNCELLVFNIASTTNPVFVTARDSGGSNASTSNVGINQLLVVGNILYVAKAGSTVQCTQVAGTATGCELMVFDISSTTDPIYRAGRDADGTATGVTAINATSLAVSSSSLYMAKAAAGTTNCSTTQSNCELMVFDISSTTNPVYTTGRDTSGSDNGTQTLAINNLAVAGNQLFTAKANSNSNCLQTAGSAVGCELMVFDISSTSNPVFTAGRDAGGGSSGTGNIAANFVTASGSNLYLAKAGDTTACSQVTGSAIGCELMLFDVASSTNPIYIEGRDINTTFVGRTNTVAQTLLFANNSLVVGKAADATPCEQIQGRRIGCEVLIFKSPTTLGGTLIGNSGLATVTTNGLVKILAAASTTNLTVATSSKLTAPAATLSASGNVRIQGAYQHNLGELALLGTNQLVSGVATTTFYDFTQVATAAATTTFSTTTPFIVERNLTLSGTPGNILNLRSASTTGQWRISPQSSTTVIARYINVQDAQNISTSTVTITCDIGCIDSGNNINWEFIVSSSSEASPWNESDWTLFETITIDETNIDENLTDFPVHVDLADLSSSFWTTTPAGAALVGTDIRVTTEDNVEVPRELVFASSTIDAGELHFKAPLVSATEDTVFKIWYNGTTTGDYADDATYGAENVWTNNFLAVYHMQDDPTGTTTDSTSNKYDGRERFGGSFTSSNLVAGALGSAVNFDGSQAIDVTNFTSQLSSLAVESWIRPTALENTANFYTIIDLKDALFLGVRDTNDSATVGTNWDSYYTWNTSADTVVDDVFQHLYVEFDDMTDTATDPVFTNNNNSVTHVDNNPVGTHIQPSTNLYIGSAFGFDPYIGDIDELRISSTTRSLNWRRAAYMNQSTTTDFYNVNESVGSSTLTAHTAGQVPDAFSAANKTNESLFAFKLIPNSGTATVTALTLTISGANNVVDTDFSNIRLYRDADSDGQYDATDVQVGGTGAMSIVGGSGSITFTGDFLATTSLDYIVVADFTAPSNGSFMTISLSSSQITITDTNVIHIVDGAVVPVQHSRNNKGGGGSGNSIGDPAPVGDGDVGGGGDSGGEVIGNNPDYFWPSSQSGSWSSGAAAYDQTDGTYATTNSVANHQYADHSFVVPGSNSIQGITIKLELSGTTGAGTVDVQLSWDGGTSWSSTRSTPTLGTSDVVYTLGSPSDLWGRAWSANEFSNANFAVRVTGNVSSNTIRLDAIQVRVYHVTSGGGAGGGGGGGGI